MCAQEVSPASIKMNMFTFHKLSFFYSVKVMKIEHCIMIYYKTVIDLEVFGHFTENV